MVIFTCIFVFITVVLSGLATVFLTVSLLSNEWEFLCYNEDKVSEIAQSKNHSLKWLPGHLGRLEMEAPVLETIESNQTKGSSKTTVVYLIPAFGGVHRMCADVSGMFSFTTFFLYMYTTGH